MLFSFVWPRSGKITALRNRLLLRVMNTRFLATARATTCLLYRSGRRRTRGITTSSSGPGGILEVERLEGDLKGEI